MNVASDDAANEPSWVAPTHQALVEADIRVVGHVPDGGLSHLIERLDLDDRIAVVPLATEEEGVALLAGAFLGGQRGALLMQSSGVGNCINMFSLLQTCRLPAFVLVTMRGQDGESNPWQKPMGEAAAGAMTLMGVDVRRVDRADDVAASVTRACIDSFDHGRGATAVLIGQQVIGVKKFTGDDADG